MPRQTHLINDVTTVNTTLEDTIAEHTTGDTIVIAPKDPRLDNYLQHDNTKQVTLFGNTDHALPSHYDYHVIPADDFPKNADQHFEIPSNSYHTVISLFSLLGGYQRGPPFMDFTRIVKPGGTIISATGLQPKKEPDHDFKGWIPASNTLDTPSLYVTRHGDYNTPNVVAVFTRKHTSNTDTEVSA